MRQRMVVVRLFVAGMLIAFSWANAVDISKIDVPASCPVPEMTLDEAAMPALLGLQVRPKEVSECWEVLCFFRDECGHPCESAYCDFRFGTYGYCQEW